MGMIIMNGKEYTSSPKDGFPPIIYSDEEREIGVWRDGKPLYQKTISFNISSGTNAVNLGVTNMGMCSFICGFKVDGTNSTFIPFVDIEAGSSIDSWSAIVYRANLSSGDITYRAASRFAGQTVYATFQYTKTTDTPGSGKYTTYGGLAHHYSTTEQVVGTWIDGKPVYEKLITFSSDVIVYSGQWVNLIQLSDYNINKIIELKLYNGEYTKPLSSYMSDVGNGYLKVFVYTNWSVKSVIIQYTKTTD